MSLTIQREVTTLSVLGGQDPGAYIKYLAGQQQSIAAQRCVQKSILVCDPAFQSDIQKIVEPIWANSDIEFELVPATFTYAAQARNLALDRARTPLISPVDVDDLFEHPIGNTPGGLDLMYLLRQEKDVDVVIGRPRDLVELHNGPTELREPELERFGRYAGQVITADTVTRMSKDELPWWLGIVLAPKDKWRWPRLRVAEDLHALLEATVERDARTYISGPSDHPHYQYRVTTVGGVTNTTTPKDRLQARQDRVDHWRGKVLQRAHTARAAAQVDAGPLDASASRASPNRERPDHVARDARPAPGQHIKRDPIR